jgi:hypothetical protein
MIRCTMIVACFVVGAHAVSADEKDKDPVKEKLFAAKVAYDGEMREYRKAAGEWFDKREDAARQDGNKKLVDEIKAERKAFDEDGEPRRRQRVPRDSDWKEPLNGHEESRDGPIVRPRHLTSPETEP